MKTPSQTLLNHGIALVAVLAILTVLALLSTTFAVFTKIEGTTAKNIVYTMEARAIADAGIEHVKSVLWYDSVIDAGSSDSAYDAWSASFDGRMRKQAPEVDVDTIPNNGPSRDGKEAVWIPVRDENNVLVGRYAVTVEDECGKINLNMASMVPPLKPNEGLSPREIYLGDGEQRGLPVSRKSCISFLRKRYGPNRVPGAAGDDNQNNNWCMNDGLDNNTDGIIDELDEGVNEWEEYVPSHTYGDDVSFFNMVEALRAFSPTLRPTRPRIAMFRKYGTLVSRDRGLRWDGGEGKFVERRNINVCSPRQLYRTLRKANEQHNFEGTAPRMRRLAACMADYRDENNVLSTVSSEYGIEAVCFNEILANEGSKIRQTYRIQSYRDDDDRVHNIAYYYGHPEYHEVGNPQDTNVANREVFFRTGDVAFPILTNKQQKATRVGSSVRIELRDFPIVGAGYYRGFRDFKELLRARGGAHMDGERVIWPENVWANGYLAVFEKAAENAKPLKVFKIKNSNEKNQLFLDGREVSAEDLIKFENRTYRYAQIRTWTHEKSYYAEHPRVSDWFVFAGLEPNDYYRVYIQETNLETPSDDSVGGHLYSRWMDVDGSILRSGDQEMHRLRYKYKDAEAQRADRKGCMDVYVTSSASCGPKSRNRFNAAYFARPDIIELINISDQPISLRGWSFVANTGSLSYDLGRINNALVYSREDGGQITDNNPVIRPNEYFYLCNNAEIFDYDHGSVKDGSWGVGAGEQMPVYEFDDDRWGVRFKIQGLRESFSAGEGWTTYVKCGNEHWKKDQFEYEVAEFQTRRGSTPYEVSADGVRCMVSGNTRNTLEFLGLKLKEYSKIRPGDFVMIVGLPRVGGFVSMTLKNEYGQIAVRLLEYGNPGKEAAKDPDRWLGWSSEKSNPTREEWILRRNPTFGGTVRKARNRSSKLHPGTQVSIKNGPFASVGEAHKVRNVAEWQLESKDSRDVKEKKLIQGVADYFCTSGVRLDAEVEGAHLSGWKPAFGESSFADTRGLTDHKAKWEKGVWADQSLAVLSGKNRGEVFAIEDNTANRLRVTGRSIPSRNLFYVRSGDKFSVGPGYSTSMYYTRTDARPGEWEWKDKRIAQGTYELALCGLNDSIKTTEFLEENHNASLDVYLYNFRTDEYELIKRGVKYDKNDTAYVGKVEPRHLSSSGGIRMKLIPHNLQGVDASGMAWFDYAYLSPTPVEGRVNVNTASKRVLMALNHVTPKLADSIYRGLDNHGKPRLKPYHSISDLLNVRGMTLNVFAAIANLVTVRSDQYNVYVLAQRIKDVNHDGKFGPDAGDEVLATSRIRALVDRSDLIAPSKGRQPMVRLVERENL